jgi:hypothetical protein
MVLVPVTIRGGLPVIAEVWYSGPDYQGEYDAGVDALYWRKRDGSPGKQLSNKIIDGLESHWQAYITEQANDWIGCNCPTRYHDGRIEGEYSEEYLKLNLKKELQK